MAAFYFQSTTTCVQMVCFFFIPSVRVKCKKMIDINGYNTPLPPDGTRVKFSEDCCLESNPFSSKYWEEDHVCSRQAYNVNFLWEKEKVVGIQEPFGIENIYIYIKQDLQSSLEHTVFRWCAPYVTVCTTQLRLLVVWLCDEHAYNFLVNCWSVCVVENMKSFSVCHLNSLVLFTLFRNWWSL